MPQIIVDRVRYAYVEAGTGPLLLFAHGTFGSKEMFAPQIARLSDRYRCVSIDLPGHGASGYDPRGWGIGDLVRAVPALITALGEEKAFLAGLSQGGALFMRAALAYPNQVAALVIMCAGANAPPPPLLDRLRAFAKVLRDEPDEQARRQAAAHFLSAFHVPGFAIAGNEPFDAEVTRALNHPRQAMPLVAEVPASYDAVFDELPRISCPTLVIWGDHDFRPALGGEIASQISGARLRLIRGAGHHVNVDEPEATAEAIEDFLDRARQHPNSTLRVRRPPRA
jgi:pimeloyl-ACP methyl ester carboxylesterase